MNSLSARVSYQLEQLSPRERQQPPWTVASLVSDNLLKHSFSDKDYGEQIRKIRDEVLEQLGVYSS